jgi:hypothetical protein
MKLVGTVRSMQVWTHEGSGHTAGLARVVAVEGCPEGYELTDVTTVSAKPGEPVTLKATARSRETREVSAEASTYAEALEHLRATVPDGWQLQGFAVVEE